MKRTKSVRLLEGAPLTFLRRRATLPRPLPGILGQPLRRLLRPRHLRSKVLKFARTPHDAAFVALTAAARRRFPRSKIPPFGLLPQCTCSALRASASYYRDGFFSFVGCYFISNDVTRILYLGLGARAPNFIPVYSLTSELSYSQLYSFPVLAPRVYLIGFISRYLYQLGNTASFRCFVLIREKKGKVLKERKKRRRVKRKGKKKRGV